MFWTSTAYALGSAGGQAAEGGGNQWSQLVIMAMVCVVFYFLLIRPQQKKAKEQRLLVESLKVGDKVITSSGIYGTVAELGDSTVVLDLGDSKITIGRSYITGPAPGAKPKAEKAEEKK